MEGLGPRLVSSDVSYKWRCPYSSVQKVRNSQGGSRRDVERRSNSGMWQWECNFVQKSERWRNGLQWAWSTGVANVNKTQALRAVVRVHFHHCHKFESKSPLNAAQYHNSHMAQERLVWLSTKLQGISNEANLGYPWNHKNMSATRCMQKMQKKWKNENGFTKV